VGRADEGFISRHIQEAQTTIEGEDQLLAYVARLRLSECAEILAASPIGLPSLAAKRDECRVEAGEERGFEEVIRTWTLHVLSGLEGG
jgi:hypothetical protein